MSVAPRVGAWVETRSCPATIARWRRSRLVWARGLKPLQDREAVASYASRLVWARGLKRTWSYL